MYTEMKFSYFHEITNIIIFVRIRAYMIAFFIIVFFEEKNTK